jgi:hypothetical protein
MGIRALSILTAILALLLFRLIFSLFGRHRVSEAPRRHYYDGGTQYNRRRGGFFPMDPDAPILHPRAQGPTGRSSAATINEPDPDVLTTVAGKPLR